ncbi:MAG: ABC transporter ATP-binding protein [Asgard group archaeon]|nr:ABC transporter ATP-binding protein [Asgard group archaeon]
MNEGEIIKIENLTKTKGEKEILSNISLIVSSGEIFALLGPDGSGKTTLIEVLLGLQNFDSGNVKIFDKDIRNPKEMREVKKISGMLPQEFSTHENLTVVENLNYWGNMFDSRMEIDDILDFTNLTDFARRRYRNLPQEKKKLMGLAITLVNDPQLLLLDEPTSGLDQFSRKEIWSLLKELKNQGKTIFLSTNNVEEPYVIADRVAIIHEGSIKEVGSPVDLVNSFSQDFKVIIRCPNDKEKAAALKALNDKNPLETKTGDIMIISSELMLLDILQNLERAEIDYADIITKRPTLNDVYLELTGKTLE